jgi:hypothetical protein
MAGLYLLSGGSVNLSVRCGEIARGWGKYYVSEDVVDPKRKEGLDHFAVLREFGPFRL